MAGWVVRGRLQPCGDRLRPPTRGVLLFGELVYLAAFRVGDRDAAGIERGAHVGNRNCPPGATTSLRPIRCSTRRGIAARVAWLLGSCMPIPRPSD
jgi:hypothetical protein